MDGTGGPLVLVFPTSSNTIPTTLMEEYNKKFDGEVYIMRSGRSTHMMDGVSTIHMYSRACVNVFAYMCVMLSISGDARDQTGAYNCPLSHQNHSKHKKS